MTSGKVSILVVDDEAPQRTILSELLTGQGYEVFVAENGKQALEMLNGEAVGAQIVLTDLQMPDIDGIELIKRVKAQRPDMDFLMATAHGSIETAIKAIKAGAFDYLLKPIEHDEVSLRIKQLIKTRKLEQKAQNLETENKRLRGDVKLVGDSAVMKRLVGEIDQISKTDATVMLTGESGVGKEVFARYIHEHSDRRKGPFVPVNCSAIPENLLESEFFGHEKGAFTGADKRNIGFFERASGGTLFLDEIGEMDLKLQPKILRALEEKKVRRVAGNSNISVDVRFVVATNKDLKQMVQAGAFREDLFYRLNVAHIILPPLRDRRDDIPALVKFLAERHAKRVNVKVKEVDGSYLEVLHNYSFPGNVRELANIVERSLIFAKNGRLTADALPGDIKGGGPSIAAPSTATDTLTGTIEGKTLNEMVGSFEKQLIQKSLAENGTDVDQAAKNLGVSRSTLYSKISKYGIKS